MTLLPVQAKADVCALQDIAEKAALVLRNNDRGGYTVPSDQLYPYQWLWDSAFIALGWQAIDEARAWQELKSLLTGQWDDGMMPHIVFHQTHESYMPGPDIWRVGRTPETSGITQPPVLGTVLRALYTNARDKEQADQALRVLFPAVLRFSQWFHNRRDPAQTGLVTTLHPWESGMDNSPAWDGALQRVSTAGLRPYERKDTALVDAAQRPRQDDYDRYMSLVFSCVDAGYDQEKLLAGSAFRVADLTTNAVLLRADRDLLWLAESLQDQAAVAWLKPVIARADSALGRLWDDQVGFFYARDLIANQPIAVPTVAGFLPLFSGTATSSQAERLAQRLVAWQQQAPYMVPSLDPMHPAFDSRRYWRGAVWVNVNWMVADGFAAYGYMRLAEEIRTQTQALLRKGQFAEYFDPLSGAPLGSQNFSWTAALALHWPLFS